MTEHTITKALEVWSLQNLVSFSIIMGIMALGLVLITTVLILRLFYGGAVDDFRMFRKSTLLLLAANISNVIGYSLVLEAPSGDYLALHPSPFWTYLKTLW